MNRRTIAPEDWTPLPGSSVTDLFWFHGGELGVELGGETDRRLSAVAAFDANLPPHADRCYRWRINSRTVSEFSAAAVYAVSRKTR